MPPKKGTHWKVKENRHWQTVKPWVSDHECYVRIMSGYPQGNDDPTLYFRPAAYCKILIARGEKKK